MEQLHRADPEGYVGLTRIYPGVLHRMNQKDAETLRWMAQFRRDPWPKRLV